MRALGFAFCLFLLVSCDWIPSKEAKTQKIVENELRSIDWNDVDQYPLFDSCDETVSKQEQKTCFETTLLQNFAMSLQDVDFVLKNELQTTLFIDFMVDATGELFVMEIDSNSVLEKQLPEFNGIIVKSLKSLPKPAPALKRGIPVKTRFRLPLQLTTKS
ncbi:MAG: hypothetical protein HKN52_00875 [Eudoraea sp.]|nr:hypothetical protein [Eudoraea sp.]